MRRRLPKLTEADQALAAVLAAVEDRDVAYHLAARRRQLAHADAKAERLQAELDQLDRTRAVQAKAIALLVARHAAGNRPRRP